MGMPLFGGHDFEFDTSKLTIVCLGAITNLREEKTSNKQSIGFSTEEKTKESSYIIKPEDLIKMGYEIVRVSNEETKLLNGDFLKKINYYTKPKNTPKQITPSKKIKNKKNKKIK